MATINTTIKEDGGEREVELRVAIKPGCVEISAKGYGAVDEWSQVSVDVFNGQLKALVWADKNEDGEPTHIIELEPARRDPSDEPKYENHYDCPCGTHWHDISVGTQNDKCPQCGKECSPTESLDCPSPSAAMLEQAGKPKRVSKPGDNPCGEIVIDSGTCQFHPPTDDPAVSDADAEIDFSRSANFLQQSAQSTLAIPPGAKPVGDGAMSDCFVVETPGFREAAKKAVETRNMSRMMAASVAAVDPEGRVLLGYHEKLQGLAFPGGKLEAGESVKQAAIREFEEETGIKLPEESSNEERPRLVLFGIEDRPDAGLIIYTYAIKLKAEEIPETLNPGEPNKFHSLEWFPHRDGFIRKIASLFDGRVFLRLATPPGCVPSTIDPLGGGCFVNRGRDKVFQLSGFGGPASGGEE